MSNRIVAALWTALCEPCKEFEPFENNRPERDWDDFYQDDFSIPVLTINKNGNIIALSRWSYKDRGWVDAGYNAGPYPQNYDDKYSEVAAWIEYPEKINLPLRCLED